MGDGPDKRNPLAPYFPSEIPHLPTSGRAWVARALLLLFAFSLFLTLIAFGISVL